MRRIPFTYAAPRHRLRWGWVPICALVVVTVAAWRCYATVTCPEHWQCRVLHVLWFSLWTINWHLMVRGSWNRWLALWPALAIPVLAATFGELVQFVWVATGHVPEWRGWASSMLGVFLGWSVIGLSHGLRMRWRLRRRLSLTVV